MRIVGACAALAIVPTAAQAELSAPTSHETFVSCGKAAAAQAADPTVPVLRGVVELNGCAADDASGIAHLALTWKRGREEGVICTDPADPTAWRCRWDTTTLKEGRYSVTLVAVDGAGNSGSFTRKVVIEAAAPESAAGAGATQGSGARPDTSAGAPIRPDAGKPETGSDMTPGPADPPPAGTGPVDGQDSLLPDPGASPEPGNVPDPADPQTANPCAEQSLTAEAARACIADALTRMGARSIDVVAGTIHARFDDPVAARSARLVVRAEFAGVDLVIEGPDSDLGSEAVVGEPAGDGGEDSASNSADIRSALEKAAAPGGFSSDTTPPVMRISAADEDAYDVLAALLRQSLPDGTQVVVDPPRRE